MRTKEKINLKRNLFKNNLIGAPENKSKRHLCFKQDFFSRWNFHYLANKSIKSFRTFFQGRFRMKKCWTREKS